MGPILLRYDSRESRKWATSSSPLAAARSGRSIDLHYRVVSKILNAADYGIPQKRERVFIVGFRCDLGTEWIIPPATHSEEALLWSQTYENDYWDRHAIARKDRRSHDRSRRALGLPIRSGPALKPWRTVRDAISDLPDPELDPSAAAEYPNHRFQPGARTYPGHTGSPLDEPAKTLKAGDHGVPGGENMLRRPDGSIRYFSVRESARLQTFPDDFLFHGSWTETMRQLGNAVPVSLSSIVANSVRQNIT